MAYDLETTSEAEEMYLITIATAIEDGRAEPVPVSHLARHLDVSGVSANQMVRKLASRGYVDYEPYRGVTLTPDGRSVAASILRRRRLWGVFLSERLGLSAGRADDIACDLEHVTPDDVANLLSDFLGDPMAGPRGRTIPSGDRVLPASHVEPLSHTPAGVHRLIALIDLPESLASFVDEQGLTPGAAIEVLGVGLKGDRLVTIDGACLHLGIELADGILVEAP
jgi:DtxR family Mn-dependent transcriptional regulator